MPSINSFAFTLLLTVCCCYGLSIKNIAAVPGDVLDSGVFEQTRLNEATMVKLAATLPNTRTHDSLQQFLRQSFIKLRSGGPHGTTLKSELAAGLVLLYLGDLGLPGYYDTAKTLFAKIGRGFPGDRTAVWMKGLCYVNSGEIVPGIKILDSLYVSGLHDEAFLTDYSSCVFHSLVPEKVGTQSIFLKAFSGLMPDTLGPSSREWSVVRVYDKQKLPCFMYGATFEIRKPLYLVFQRVLERDGRSFQLGSFPKAPVPIPAFVPFPGWTETVHCKLFIDLIETDGPLFEYLSSRISGKYDSINVTAELKKQQGITLRCYTLPRFLDDNGQYTAIATFDRPFIDLQKQRRAKTALPEFKKIRYTLVLQSSTDVQEVSESKFQTILDAFFD